MFATYVIDYFLYRMSNTFILYTYFIFDGFNTEKNNLVIVNSWKYLSCYNHNLVVFKQTKLEILFHVQLKIPFEFSGS